MLILYHFPRAICAQKVRLALAEKGIGFESRLLTPADMRSAEYLALNPNGYAPTLVHDGQVIIESRTISEYIDDAFPEPPLMPVSAGARAMVRNWTKQIDDSLHLNIFILTFTTSFRDGYLGMPLEAQQRFLPLNPIKRLITLDLAERGAESRFFAMAVDRYRILLAAMEQALSDAPWLSGERHGLADIDYTPYLRRLDELGMWPLVADRYPHVKRWYSLVRARPSFAVAVSDWESDADREREAADIARATPLFQAALAA